MKKGWEKTESGAGGERSECDIYPLTQGEMAVKCDHKVM